MGYRLNRPDEPAFMAVPKPMLTLVGIHYRLESCGPLLLVVMILIYWAYLSNLDIKFLRAVTAGYPILCKFKELADHSVFIKVWKRSVEMQCHQIMNSLVAKADTELLSQVWTLNIISVFLEFWSFLEADLKHQDAAITKCKKFQQECGCQILKEDIKCYRWSWKQNPAHP